MLLTIVGHGWGFGDYHVIIGLDPGGGVIANGGAVITVVNQGNGDTARESLT